MATQPQPPFWIPRPGWDESWSMPTEYESSATIQILTNLKFFAAGGQVPTRRYSRDYVLDDSSFWQGSPTKSYIAFNNINFAMYGAMGQVPTRNWARQIAQQDDSSLWGITPLKSAPITELLLTLVFLASSNADTVFDFGKQNQDDPQWQRYSSGSWLIPALTTQKIYGFQGQVATRNYNSLYAQDDAAPWSLPAPWFNTKLELYLGRPTLYGSPGQSVTPQWGWQYNADDSAAWNWFPTHVGGIGSLNFYPPPFNPNAVKPSFFVPSPNDQVYEWYGNRYGSFVISAITNQKIVMAARWIQSGGDSSAFWAGSPRGINVPLGGEQGPRFFEVIPWDWQDDSSLWQGQPTTSGTQRQLTTALIMAPQFFQSGGDDASTWRAEPRHNRTLFPPTTQNTFYGLPGLASQFRGNWTLDDPPTWFPALANLVTPGALTLIQPSNQMGPAIQWAPDDEDQAALWSGSGVQSNQKVLSIPPTPPGKPSNQYPRGVWRIDDWVDPVFGPTANRTIQGLLFPKVYGVGGQGYTFRSNWGQDDPTVFYQRTPAKNQILFATPIGYPPGSSIALTNLTWRAAPFYYDVDAPGWVGQPTESLSKQNFGIPFPPVLVPLQYYQWPTVYDVAQSQWDAKPRFAYPALTPIIPNVMPPQWFQGGGDSSSFWQGEPIGRVHLNIGTAQGPRPLSVYPWQWSDDAPTWQWVPRYPTIQNILAAPTSPPVMPPQYFQSGGDSESAWSWVPPFNVHPAIIQVVPATVLWIPDDEDAASIWVGSGVSVKINLPGYVPAANAQMAPSILWSPDDPDEHGLWSGSGRQSNQNVLSIPPVPTLSLRLAGYPRGVWRIDDWVDPLYGPTTNSLLLKYQSTPRPGLGIGEAVPPPWQALTTQDDPAYWLGTPLPSSIINSVPQFFGQKGQAIPFRWNATLNDPPMFQGAPSAAWPLSLLGQPKLFGQGGQVLPFRPNFTIDDPPMWQGAPSTNVLAQLYTKTTYPPGGQTALVLLRWTAAPFNYDVGEAPGWVGQPFSPDYMLSGPAKPIAVKWDWTDFFRRGRRRQ